MSIKEKAEQCARWQSNDSQRSNQIPDELMKTIYISGQITGLPYEDALSAFDKAEKLLQSLGYDVINPMTHVPYNENWSWYDYMGEDIKLLGKCDSIYMLKGWKKSDGARIEYEIAIRKNKKIIYEK